MTIELVRNKLYCMAQDMTDLANELDVTGGKKLTPEEELMIRMAMLPFFKELVDECLLHYMMNGSADEFIARLNEVIRMG